MTYFDQCVIAVLITCSYRFRTIAIDVERELKSI